MYKKHKLSSCRSKAVYTKFKQEGLNRTNLLNTVFTCVSGFEIYTCTICKFTTNLKVDLTEHFRVSHAGKEVNEELETIFKRYCCKNCDFGTHSMLVLTQHIYKSCNNEFDSNLKVKQEKKEEKENWLQCEHCAYKTRVKAALKSHDLRKHKRPEEINWFKCEHCPYKAKMKVGLKNHLLSAHTKPEDIQWYKCEEEQCSYKSKYKIHLNQHILRKHDQPKQCSYSYNSTCEINFEACLKQNKVVDRFKCEHCSFETNQKFYFINHSLLFHSKSKVDPIIEFLNCEHCSYVTKNESTLEKHNLSKHAHVKSEDLSVEQDETWFKCDQCPYTTTIQRSFNHHVGKNKHFN